MKPRAFFRGVQGGLLAFCLCFGPVISIGAEARETATAKSVNVTPWSRIVLIGASVTAGFTESEPLGGPTTAQYRLTRYLDAAIATPHQPVRNLASTLFFTQPETEGQREINEALKTNPTLVLGLDFLFWFSYGQGKTDDARLQRFEHGLRLLQSISAPLVLGDIPDASAAVHRMLSEDQIPSTNALVACNRRLREWAAGRQNVTVLPLASYMAAVQAGKPIKLHGHLLAGEQTRTYLQPDRLHPTPAGAAFLAITLLDAFQSSDTHVSGKDIRWSPAEVYRLAALRAQADAKK